MKEEKPNNSLSSTVAKQYKLYSKTFTNTNCQVAHSCELWISQKDAEEEARSWANVAMVSCVADPNESEAKGATNKRREPNWHLSEIDNRKQASPSLASEKELHLLI